RRSSPTTATTGSPACTASSAPAASVGTETMADRNADALTPEAAPPLRTLPRGVQVSVGLLLAVAVVLGVLLFNRDSGGGGFTDPGLTVPRVGDRLAALPLTTADGQPF